MLGPFLNTMGKLTKEYYQKLIDEDIDWLLKQPQSLERDHIRTILVWSVDALYPPTLAERLKAKGIKPKSEAAVIRDLS